MFILDNSVNVSNCRCGQLDKYHNPYSYCMRWFSSLPPLCFLRGGSSARHCPGARKLRGTETYLTSDEAICNASKGELQSLKQQRIILHIYVAGSSASSEYSFNKTAYRP